MLAGLAIAGIGLALFLVIMWPTKRVKGDEVHRIRCPCCAQKLRFFARQVGHSVLCPRCGGNTVLPPVEDEDLL